MNLRKELRAYELANACRLASVLLELTTGSVSSVTRDEVAARWAERYPWHATQGGRSIRNRISNVIGLLREAQMVTTQGDSIVIVSELRLRVSASNLSVVVDGDGASIRPALWRRRPAAPNYLWELQQELEQGRTAAQAGLQA